MPNRILIGCAWAGPATVVITLLGWLIAGILRSEERRVGKECLE